MQLMTTARAVQVVPAADAALISSNGGPESVRADGL